MAYALIRKGERRMKKLISCIVVLAMLLCIMPHLAYADNAGTRSHIERTLLGDVTNDGKLTVADALIMLRSDTGLITLTEEQRIAADIDFNGFVNVADAIYVLRVAVGLEEARYNEVTVADAYTVHYDFNLSEETGHENDYPDEQVLEETAYTVKAGFDYGDLFFCGWLNSVDSRVYAGGELMIMPSSDVTLTAQWQEASVTPTPTPTEEPTPTPTEEPDVILIHNVDELKAVNGNLSAKYALANDIDLKGENWVPLGWQGTSYNSEHIEFTGEFDGNGYTIRDLYIDYHGQNTSSVYKDAGLFAKNAGVIKNLNIYTNLADNSADYYYGIFADVNVGAVAGVNSGLISGCRVYGYVGSLDYYDSNRGACGGICGENLEDGIVEKSSFEGAVDGLYWIGGLIGKNFGTLRESYFAGGVNATTSDNILSSYNVRYIGGLCGGAQDSVISDCYMVCTSYIAGWNAVGGLVGWYNRGTIENTYICISGGGIYYHDNASLTAGYFPHGEDSLPSLQSGLYNFTNGASEMPSEYSPEIWDNKASFLPSLPDLINCRRGSSWFDVFTV